MLRPFIVKVSVLGYFPLITTIKYKWCIYTILHLFLQHIKNYKLFFFSVIITYYTYTKINGVFTLYSTYFYNQL